MLRTHRVGQLDESLTGSEVTVCGWVDSRRDHGKVTFIDVRDRWGKLQVVFTPKPYADTYAKAKTLRNEDVIRLTGEVNLRPKGTQNPKIPTGKVEVFGKELEVLSHCDDLPFPVQEELVVGEEVRLHHRYLDLRRQSMRDKFILRHKILHLFGIFLDRNDFLQIETPFLNKSTPEGARDFLIPCRLNPGKFYALPQSPQLFKQILMVSGIDRYFQLVRCFRDEDLRKDRQPEFSQLDMEMSFIDEEDIFSLTEEMFAYLFKEALGVSLTIPFTRITYDEAIKKHSRDNPDIGEGPWRFVWVVDFPMFEYNETEKRWQCQHHPFTSPKLSDAEYLEGDLGRVRARSYDLVLNGQEIASGSIRIHTQELQERIFNTIGISEKEAKERFGFLLRSFRYGVPPHGGIAFGLDRLCAIVTGSESIREVIAFPKTQRGMCLLTGAPSGVKDEQLKDLGIETVATEEEPRDA